MKQKIFGYIVNLRMFSQKLKKTWEEEGELKGSDGRREKWMSFFLQNGVEFVKYQSKIKTKQLCMLTVEN